jgi:acyl-CoA reductase-like NAD-dependent aldehyde dehydrogenase
MALELQSRYKLFIGGEFRDASDGGIFEIHNPATGEKLAEAAEATAADVDAAAKAARAAFETSGVTNPAERVALLTKIADIIEANSAELAAIESADTGKPIRETSFIDVPMSADHFRYFAGLIRSEEGRATMLDQLTLGLVLNEPIGVVGQIVPWNFPLLIASWKIAPALAAGCTIVLKPSSHTSLSVLRFIELVAEVLPPGVLNIVTGSGSKVGNAILQHEGFDKFAFTGSTEVGYTVADAAAKKLIPATLELGGKSANIFFDDCNRPLALDSLQMGILFNQGEVCAAGSRVYVQESFYDEFVEAAIEAFGKINVGDPTQFTTQMGSLINQDQLDKVLGYIEIAKQEGATVAVGGYRLTEGELANGAFVAPTLLTGVTNDMRVAQEEIFGPVASIIKFTDEEEVIRFANDSEYGLAGGVFTQDINRAIRVARGVKSGRIWVNQYNVVAAGAPFGGYKKSGYGRETDKAALDAYTQQKSIMINLNENPSGFY